MRMVVTGGAGFIGSHLVDRLVADGHDVRVVDSLTTGVAEQVHPDVELVVTDICNSAELSRAFQGAEVVFHQAARGSVQASVQDPLATDQTNVHGTLTVLAAARDAAVRRVVAASSSSVYGGADVVPTPESQPLRPRSPYAVSKLAGEHYCRVYAELYGLETVVLRYFNVFGPRQRADSAYAAVIPRFVEAFMEHRRPEVHGDGLQSRDFTFVDDTVLANLLAATAPAAACSGKVYNVAGGRTLSLLDLLDHLGDLFGTRADPVFRDPRPGDIRCSQADITSAGHDLGFCPAVGVGDGLSRTVAWAVNGRPPRW